MIRLLLTLPWLMTAVTPVDHAPKTNLKIEISNIEQQKGSIFIAVFKPGDAFPEGKPVEAKKVNVTGATVTATIPLEPGQYAVALFHDVNSNNKMDKNMLGIPKEPYGFSMNFKPRMSKPKFSDCQITVGEAGKTIDIKLI